MLTTHKLADSLVIVALALSALLTGLSVAAAVISAPSRTVSQTPLADGSLQWTASGLGTSDIVALAVAPSSPNILYAGDGNYIYKSTNSGANWDQVYFGFAAYCFAIDPTNADIVYACKYGYEVLKTINGGTSWVEIGSAGAATHRAIAFDPTSTNVVYLGVEAGWGVYRTTTGGSAWTSMLSGVDVTSLAIGSASGSVLLKAIYVGTKDYYSTSGGVYRSIDDGVTWTKVMTHTQVNAVAVDPANSLVVYAGTEGNGVYKSSDGGVTWTPVNTGLNHLLVRVLAIDPTNTNTVYAGTWEGGVYQSADGGASWSAVNVGLTNTYIRSLAIDPTNTTVLYAGTEGGGVFKSSSTTLAPITGVTISGPTQATVNTACSFAANVVPVTATTPITYTWSPAPNSGQGTSSVSYTWATTGVKAITVTAQNVGGAAANSHPITINAALPTTGTLYWAASGLGTVDVKALAIAPTSPNILYAGDGSRIYKTTESGANWNQVHFGFAAYSLAIDPTNADVVYAGQFGYEVLKTINGGMTWVELPSIGASTHRAIAIDPTHTSTVYVGIQDGWGVYKTTTGGSAWSNVLPGVTALALAVGSTGGPPPQVVYAGAQDYSSVGGGVYKSADDGVTWTEVMTHTQVNALTVDPTNPNVVYAGTEGSGVFKSTDGGATWSAVNAGLAHSLVRVLAIDPTNTSVIYAGTWEGGVYQSANGGASWSAVNAGLINTYIQALVIDPTNTNVLYAGTQGGGVFKSSTAGGETPITGLTAANSSPTVLGNVTYFTASVTGGSNIAYIWDLGDGSPTVAGANVIHTFAGTGVYTASVTAMNAMSSVTASTLVTIVPAPGVTLLDSVTIGGPTEGTVNTAYTFTANVSPPAASRPITYTWSPAPNSGQGAATVSYSWATVGAKAIAVTAQNAGNAVSDAHTIAINDQSSGGDVYEPDDTCTQARPISPDGSTQIHTFHQQADQDWVTLNAVSGTTYLISAQVPDASPADVELSVYDQCGGLPTTQDPTFSPEVRLQFNASASGPLYLKLRNHSSLVYGVQVTYHLSVRASGGASLPGALILVAGRLRENDALQSNIHNVANSVYRLFQSHDYTADRIYYLATDSTLPGWDASATADHLQAALTQWVLDKVDANRPLTLYLVDHGIQGRIYLDKLFNEWVTPDQLDGWLTLLEAARPNLKVNIIIEACHSGSFVGLSPRLSKPGRVVMTSTGADKLAWSSDRGARFSDALIAALGQDASLYGGFQEATWAVQAAGYDQTPWLDDDGDGTPNEANEGGVAQTRGFNYAGTLADEGWPPYIAQAIGPSVISRGRGDIRAKVLDDETNGVRLVWAVIYAPSYQPPAAGEEIVKETLPSIVLANLGNDEYGAAYTGFDEMGLYRVVVYAEDIHHLEARPLTIEVRTGWQVYLPVVVKE